MEARVKKWPYRANEMRENAIARMISIEQAATASLSSAQRRGDAEEIFRLSQILLNAQASKYELELAYHVGRE
jgi:hypothetical protein